LNEGDIASNGIIPNENDVLAGRGAFVNSHNGNTKFRILALERKSAFDAGSYADKRALAAEIVRIIRSRNPSGRFLKRASVGSSTQEREKMQLWGGLPFPRGLQGPWEELTDEQAVHKACQVMRDLRRPDRIDRDTSGFLLPINETPAPAVPQGVVTAASLPLQQPQAQHHPLQSDAAVASTVATSAAIAAAAVQAVAENVIGTSSAEVVSQLSSGPTDSLSRVSGEQQQRGVTHQQQPQLQFLQDTNAGGETATSASNELESSLIQHAHHPQQQPQSSHYVHPPQHTHPLNDPSIIHIDTTTAHHQPTTPNTAQDMVQQTQHLPSSTETTDQGALQHAASAPQPPPASNPAPVLMTTYIEVTELAPSMPVDVTEPPPDSMPLPAPLSDPPTTETSQKDEAMEPIIDTNDASTSISAAAAAEAAVAAIDATFDNTLPLATMAPSHDLYKELSTAEERSGGGKKLEIKVEEV